MAIGEYKSKSKATILYIKDILENYSTIEKPLSNKQIKRILEEYPYNIRVGRDTIKEYLVELASYDSDLYRSETSDKDNTSGYNYGWYYNRSSSIYDNIKEIADDIRYNPALPDELAKKKASDLMDMIPVTYKGKSRKDSLADDSPVKQHEPTQEGYRLFNQLRQIIKDNKGNTRKEKYIMFNFYKHTIKNKKHVLDKMISHFKEVLPLAIVEWNYHYWLICYIGLTKKLGHFRIDLMCDLKVLEKPKIRNTQMKRLIDKVNSSDNIRKYMNEHIYFGNNYGSEYIEEDKIITCTLKIRENNNFGITYFYDIFKDNFKIIAEKEGYYLVKVRCTEKSIKNIILLNPELIEIVEPEQTIAEVSKELEKMTKEALINTNQQAVKPTVYLFKERLPKKVSDDEKWFYIDFTFDNVNRFGEETFKQFYDYLLDNGFKVMAMKKRHNMNAERYLVTDKYDSYNQIVNLIKEYANTKARSRELFYHYIKKYSIYEYKYGKYTQQETREFYEVYYYKGLRADTYPDITLHEYLKLEKQRKEKKSGKK